MNYYGEISALLGIEMNREYIAREKATGQRTWFVIWEDGLRTEFGINPEFLHKLLKGEAEIVEKIPA